MELTSDVLLLVRPDFVVYDEVRKTDDFKIFADMRLAGVGLIGVTHANRAIDAVQRLIGRVELGMIPQVVDTVIHIEAGKIQKVLEMSFTVKVPAGMQEADLARPVIEVRDFQTKRAEFEIYTYGEQVVVMPLSATGGGERSAKDRFAAKALRQELKHWVGGSFDIEFAGENSLTLFADERLIPQLIGRGGKAVQELEGAIGFKVDIRPLRERRTGGVGGRERGVDRGDGGGGRPVHRGRDREGANGGADAGAEPEEAFMGEEEAASRAAERYAELTPELRKSKKNIVLMVDRGLAGQEVEVVVDDEPIFAATVGSKGDVRINRRSEWGRAIDDALVNGQLIRIRV
jgi:ATPase